MTIYASYREAYAARAHDQARKFYKTARLRDSVQCPRGSGLTLAAGTYVGVQYEGDGIFAIYTGRAGLSPLVGYVHEQLLGEFVL